MTYLAEDVIKIFLRKGFAIWILPFCKEFCQFYAFFLIFCCRYCSHCSHSEVTLVAKIKSIAAKPEEGPDSRVDIASGQ